MLMKSIINTGDYRRFVYHTSGMWSNSYYNSPNGPDVPYVDRSTPHVGTGYEMWSQVRGGGGSGSSTFSELQLQYGTTYEQQASDRIETLMSLGGYTAHDGNVYAYGNNGQIGYYADVVTQACAVEVHGTYGNLDVNLSNQTAVGEPFKIGDEFVPMDYFGCNRQPFSNQNTAYGSLFSLNTAAYLIGSSTYASELYHASNLSSVAANDARRALNAALPRYFNGASKAVASAANDYRLATGIAKGISKPMFALGLALTAGDIVENNASTSSLLWGAADTGVALAALLVVSGPAAPFVAAGAFIYFTARFGYTVYDEFQKK